MSLSVLRRECEERNMSDNYLDKILPVLQKVDEDRKEQFQAYFKNAPAWVINSFTVEKMKKGKTFIREGTTVNMIYFIIDGLIKATDYRIYGIKFDFILFTELYAYGGMEVVMGLDKYRTSIQTVTDCTVLKIPKNQYARWIKSDLEALRHEAKLMGEYLLEQSRSVRAFLFLQGADRLALLLTNRYKKFAIDGVLKLKNDRQELSDYTGISVKTITRAVKKLEEDGMVKKQGKYLLINEEQYEKMRDNLSKILEEDD